MLKKAFANNKKGGEGGGLGLLITGVIAVIILVSILFFITKPVFKERVLPFIKGISDYNSTKKVVLKDETLRYSIEKGKAQYYDGLNWNDFNTVEINGKKIENQEISSRLRNAYLSNSLRMQKEININQAELNQYTYFLINTILKSNGDASIFLYIYGKVEGIYTLKINDNLEFGFFQGKDPRTPEILSRENSMKSEAISWRDAVLKNPVEIIYTSQSGSKEAIGLCITKLKGDLIIHLDEPKSQCS